MDTPPHYVTSKVERFHQDSLIPDAYVVEFYTNGTVSPFVVDMDFMKKNPDLMLSVKKKTPVPIEEQEDPTKEGYVIPLLTVTRHNRVMSLRDWMRSKVYDGYFTEKEMELIHGDDQGIISLSSGDSAKLLCETIFLALTTDAKPRGFTVTDACAGLGGDSMQFLSATNAAGKMFGKVTSVEILEKRHEQLEYNMTKVDEIQEVRALLSATSKYLKPSKHTSAKVNFATIRDNYMNVRDTLTQDVLYLDPPWGSDYERGHAYEELSLSDIPIDDIVKHVIAKNELIEVENRTKMIVIKAPKQWNTTMLQTIIDMKETLVTKLPQIRKHDYWMISLSSVSNNYFSEHQHKTMTGFMGWRSQETELYKFFPNLPKATKEAPMFLQHIWRTADDDNKDHEGNLRDEIDWNTQCTQQYLPNNSGTKENLHNGEKKLLDSSMYTILYGIHRIRDKMNKYKEDSDFRKEKRKIILRELSDEQRQYVKQIDEKRLDLIKRLKELKMQHETLRHKAHLYLLDQIQINKLKNKKKNLKEQKLLNQTYLERYENDNKALKLKLKNQGDIISKELDDLAEQKKVIAGWGVNIPFTWNEILENTIVLYIGAAGLNKDTHHFNELMKAIPLVHFACYDIRKIETALEPEYESRITRFHKIFTSGDAEQWINFSKIFKNKSIIVISDIRSDWQQAKFEIQATKNVILQKLNLLHAMDYSGRDQDIVARIDHLRKEIKGLLSQTKAISSWIDDSVQSDTFLQWSWVTLLQNNCKSCVMFSAKCREPYQSVGQTHADYLHFTGVELFQNSVNRSTETRTNIVFEGYTYEEPLYRDPIISKSGNIYPCWKNTPAQQCIKYHFRVFGTADNFETKNIYYTDNNPKRLDARAVWYMAGARSKKIHEEKFAWYNAPEQATVKNAVENAIIHMYETWQGDYNKDQGERDKLSFDMREWCQKMKTKTLKKKIRPPAHNYTFVEELLRLNDSGLDVQLEYHDRTIEFDKTKYARMNSWHSTHRAMRRYDFDLRQAAESIWNLSVVAMETLLTLNMNMKWSEEITENAIRDYECITKHMFDDPEVAYRMVTDKKKKDKLIANGKKNMPSLWVFSQLRYHICNPLSLALYQDKKKDLENRYDKIKPFMANLALENPEISPLRFRVGSCEDDVHKAHFTKHMQDHDLKKSMARDWYCYWLRAILEEDPATNIESLLTKEQIRDAIREVYMEKNGENEGWRMKLSVNTEEYSGSSKKPLQVETWPRAKPILYYVCEKGSLALLEFFLMDCDAENIKRKINTPRNKQKNASYQSNEEEILVEGQNEVKELELQVEEEEEEGDSLHILKEINDEIEGGVENENGTSDAAEVQKELEEKTNAIESPIHKSKSKFILRTTQIYSYPLHAAVYSGHADIVEYLLANGANVKNKNYWNEDALKCGQNALGEFRKDPQMTSSVQKCVDLIKEHLLSQ